MSKYNKLYNLSQLSLNLSLDCDENLINELVDNINSYIGYDGVTRAERTINFEVIQDANRLQDLKELVDKSNPSTVKGYLKTPLSHIETDNSIVNYDEKNGVCVCKDKNSETVSLYLNDSNTFNKSIPMYLVREMLYRENENLGNLTLHSASVEKNGRAYAIVGGPGAGKTSLLLAFLKSGDGKVNYISNDINFVSPDCKNLFSFQIPMLLSKATAESYFGEDMSEIEKQPTISYYHSKDKEMITKYKLSNESVERLFSTKSKPYSRFCGMVVPNFQANMEGYSVQILDKKFAKELISEQVLEKDDRFQEDYLGLLKVEPSKEDDQLSNLIDNTPVVMLTYGKDIFNEKQGDIQAFFDFMEKASESNYELHCHTACSDGKYSPEELIDLSIGRSISTLAITDHNTMSGYIKAKKYLKETGREDEIDLISAIELDANDFSCLHILGYGIEDVDTMQTYLNGLDEANQKVYNSIISNLVNMGVQISAESILKEFNCENLSKQRIGNYLINHGYAKNTNEVTKKYLGVKAGAYVPRVQPTAVEVIEKIHECGGISVLAHPMELLKYNPQLQNNSDVLDYIGKLAQNGLDGVECYSTKHNAEQVRLLESYCEGNNLVAFSGSDYHGKEGQTFGLNDANCLDNVIFSIHKNREKDCNVC